MYWYNFAASVLEIFAICCLLSILREMYWNLIKILVIVIILAGISTILDFFNIEINMGINIFLMVVLIKVAYRNSIIECLFDVVCSVMLVLTIEMVTTSLLCYIDPTFVQHPLKMILYLALLMLFFFIVLKITQPRNKIGIYYQKYQSGIWIICLNFVFIQLAEMYNWNKTNTIDASIVVLVLASVISNLILAFKLIKNQQQKEELKRQKELMDLKEEFFQQMAADHHDFAKHLRVIGDLLEDDNNPIQLQTAKDYIKALVSKKDTNGSVIYAGDGILSAILHAKRKEAYEKNIIFTTLTKKSISKFPFTQTEAVELIGNLLDNAFEAVEDLEPELKKVLFEIGEKNGVLFLQTINSLPRKTVKVSQMLERGVSTKEGALRGYGLYNIKSVAEKYGGRVEIQQNEDIVIIRLLFK